ncbi:unnamed protein product [Closterium sp. NIES-54]
MVDGPAVVGSWGPIGVDSVGSGLWGWRRYGKMVSRSTGGAECLEEVKKSLEFEFPEGGMPMGRGDPLGPTASSARAMTSSMGPSSSSPGGVPQAVMNSGVMNSASFVWLEDGESRSKFGVMAHAYGSGSDEVSRIRVAVGDVKVQNVNAVIGACFPDGVRFDGGATVILPAHENALSDMVCGHENATIHELFVGEEVVTEISYDQYVFERDVDVVVVCIENDDAACTCCKLLVVRNSDDGRFRDGSCIGDEALGPYHVLPAAAVEVPCIVGVGALLH